MSAPTLPREGQGVSEHLDADVVRRRIVSGGCSALLAGLVGFVPLQARAARLIDGAPNAGRGGLEDGGAEAPTAAVSPRAEQALPPAPAPRDWREFLLSGERSVTMRRGASGVQRVRYRMADGSVDSQGYALACFLLRDVRANRVSAIDPGLLDAMCGVQRWLSARGRAGVIEILSGFRTQTTNNATEGAAKNSMHLQGRATDFVVAGVSASTLGAMAREFNRGGIGVYFDKGFVHIDTGAPRVWVRS